MNRPNWASKIDAANIAIRAAEEDMRGRSCVLQVETCNLEWATTGTGTWRIYFNGKPLSDCRKDIRLIHSGEIEALKDAADKAMMEATS